MSMGCGCRSGEIMKTNDRQIWISLCGMGLLAGALLLLIWKAGSGSWIFDVGRAKEGADNRKHYVAVIVKSTTSAYWKSVFAGANAAKTEYNLDITVEGPEDEEDCEAQNQMIDGAVERGAEVIVLSAVDFQENARAVERAAMAGVKVVVIDSDVDSDKVSCRISTDNYQAGRMVGETVLDTHKQAVYVGIVNFDQVSANGQQREAGFRDAVAGDSRVAIVDAVNVNSNVESAREATRQMIAEHPQINVIVTFNEWTSLGVGYAIKELGLAEETKVVAFDSNVVSVGMLETGEVDALIVQNPYAMGYLGIECAYRLINDGQIDQPAIDTTTTVVTRENMFSEECQRILFAFD